MPVVSVRLTKFEAMCLDLLAHYEWSRGQVLRELIHGAAKARLRLSVEQRAKLNREFIVRRRRPKRKVRSAIMPVDDRGLFGL
jgi:hypothetical protein